MARPNLCRRLYPSLGCWHEQGRSDGVTNMVCRSVVYNDDLRASACVVRYQMPAPLPISRASSIRRGSQTVCQAGDVFVNCGQIVNNFLEESLSSSGIHAKKGLSASGIHARIFRQTGMVRLSRNVKQPRFGFVRSMKKMCASSGTVRGRILPEIDSRRGRQNTAQLFPKRHAGLARLV